MRFHLNQNFNHNNLEVTTMINGPYSNLYTHLDIENDFYSINHNNGNICPRYFRDVYNDISIEV